VCADSRQVFAALELGTGKPTRAERERVPHHLFDALALEQRASAGWYAAACESVRRAIQARGRTPLLVGGSGLYLRAAQHGLSAEPPHDPVIRERLRAEVASVGPEALHARLATVDPQTAARLQPRDRQRIGRALEVWEISGRPLSWWHRRPPLEPRAERWRIIELAPDPARLRERVHTRTRAMFDHGLVEEVEGLVAAGAEPGLRRLRAVGYDEALDLVAGRLSRAEAEQRTSLRTLQLAKRQRTWFRHQVRTHRVDALDLDLAVREIEALWERPGHDEPMSRR
jgi:tRNA dimethylallyltransferase